MRIPVAVALIYTELQILASWAAYQDQIIKKL